MQVERTILSCRGRKTAAQGCLDPALPLMRLDHVACRIIHANHDRMRTAVVQRVCDSIADRIRFGRPQATKGSTSLTRATPGRSLRGRTSETRMNECKLSGG